MFLLVPGSVRIIPGRGSSGLLRRLGIYLFKPIKKVADHFCAFVKFFVTINPVSLRIEAMQILLELVQRRGIKPCNIRINSHHNLPKSSSEKRRGPHLTLIYLP